MTSSSFGAARSVVLPTLKQARSDFRCWVLPACAGASRGWGSSSAELPWQPPGLSGCLRRPLYVADESLESYLRTS
jgi:hypothetical protein